MDANIEALLKMDFDAWTYAGTGESDFLELQSLPKVQVTGSSPSSLQVESKAMTPSATVLSKAAAAAASWPQGKDYDTPAGGSILREVKFLRPEERTLVQKSALVKQFLLAGDKVQSIYDGLILGDLTRSASLVETAQILLGLLMSDPNGILGLALMRGNSLSEYQYRHAVHTSLLAMATAIPAGYSKQQILEIGMGGILADIGMLLVHEDILGKTGKLTVEELGEIHRHIEQGCELLEGMEDLPSMALNIVLQHHERLSGAGYPRHLKDSAISHAARIVAIADTLCAMVHKRSHRDAMLPYSALDRVIKMSQMQFLDPVYVKHLANWLSAYPVGSGVKLLSGRMGRVVAANFDDFQRPVVAIMKSATGQALPIKQIIVLDLRTLPQEKIVGAIEDAEAGFKGLDGF